jgi:transposase
MLALTYQPLVPTVRPATKASAPDPAESRRQRGLAIAALCKIKPTGNGFYSVPSQSGGTPYTVTLNPPYPTVPMCSCPDFEKRGEPCKHVFAVRCVVERETHPDGSETITETVTVTRKTTAPRKTYKQDWPAYNKAQTTEKARFQSLLFDLCRGIAEPPRKPGPGRKPVPLADAVFASVFKVFTTVSARRFMCDLEDAHAKGYLAKVPHFNAIPNTLEMPEVTPILKWLITVSSLPLKAVEVDFAVDSSGFTTSRFLRWFDVKYGKPRQEAYWVKCHLMTGVRTNVVTAVEIEERYAADSPQFAPLVNATAKAFQIREVSADAAYLSYENMDAVATVGGTPFIAFKSNTTAAQGGIFERMFHLYNLNRDEYLTHYHKRSNVETTFSMIKAKFGDHLRSKTDTALINEALCKILCHNVCCLIMSALELGIVPAFWQDAATEPDPSAIEAASDTDQLMSIYDWM